MRNLVLGLLLLLAAPTAGWAGVASYGCGYTGGSAGVIGTATGSNPTKTTIDNDSLWCFRFVNADATTTIVGPVRVQASSALITFDPDLYQTVTTTARLIPRMCPLGAAVDTTSLATISRSCLSIGGANGAASLDGTEGSASTQNAAIRVGPGTYYFEINAVCEAGDTCQVSVKGEGAISQ